MLFDLKATVTLYLPLFSFDRKIEQYWQWLKKVDFKKVPEVDKINTMSFIKVCVSSNEHYKKNQFDKRMIEEIYRWTKGLNSDENNRYKAGIRDYLSYNIKVDMKTIKLLVLGHIYWRRAEWGRVFLNHETEHINGVRINRHKPFYPWSYGWISLLYLYIEPHLCKLISAEET